MKYDKILLDLDEVLVDFVGGFGDLVGYDFEGLDVWNMASFMDIPIPEFEKHLNDAGFEFWANLEPLPKAWKIMGLLESYETDMYIVSSPTNNPESWAGKKDWVDKYIPDYSKKLILTKHKELMADPFTILIDDSPSNVRKFKEEGGDAIAYPKLWNSSSDYVGSEIEYIKSKIEHTEI